MSLSLIVMLDRWRGPSQPFTITAEERSSGWIRASWPFPSRSSLSLPLSPSARWCTDGGQISVESSEGPGRRRSWPPCCSSACGSSTSSSPHWRPTATSRASKMTRDDEREGWDKSRTWKKWRRMNVWIWKWWLSHWSITPSLYARLNARWMDGCTDEEMKEALKYL